MSSLHLTLVHEDDEHVTLEINGEEAVTASHDEHGWAGIQLMEETARQIAEAAGLDLTEA